MRKNQSPGDAKLVEITPLERLGRAFRWFRRNTYIRWGIGLVSFVAFLIKIEDIFAAIDLYWPGFVRWADLLTNSKFSPLVFAVVVLGVLFYFGYKAVRSDEEQAAKEAEQKRALMTEIGGTLTGRVNERLGAFEERFKALSDYLIYTEDRKRSLERQAALTSAIADLVQGAKRFAQIEKDLERTPAEDRRAINVDFTASFDYLLVDVGGPFTPESELDFENNDKIAKHGAPQSTEITDDTVRRSYRKRHYQLTRALEIEQRCVQRSEIQIQVAKEHAASIITSA